MVKELIIWVLMLALIFVCNTRPVNVKAYTNETSSKIEESLDSRQDTKTWMWVMTQMCHNYPVSNKAYKTYIDSCNDVVIDSMDYLH